LILSSAAYAQSAERLALVAQWVSRGGHVRPDATHTVSKSEVLKIAKSQKVSKREVLLNRHNLKTSPRQHPRNHIVCGPLKVGATSPRQNNYRHGRTLENPGQQSLLLGRPPARAVSGGSTGQGAEGNWQPGPLAREALGQDDAGTTVTRRGLRTPSGFRSANVPAFKAPPPSGSRVRGPWPRARSLAMAILKTAARCATAR
jgi:hypothetical protein